MTRRWLAPVVIGGMLLFTAIVYASLPEQVPTHWSVRGEVDGWSSRRWGAVMAPLLALGIWLILPALRRLDPRRRNYDRFDGTFWLVVNVIVLFLGVVHVISLGTALGWDFNGTRVMLASLGLVFIGLGNYLPRLRSNWWMGIRTPWTLESEAVWRATHRLAGYTFVVGGVVALVALLLPEPWAFGVAVTAMAAAGLVPAFYSYVAYRRERRPDAT